MTLVLAAGTALAEEAEEFSIDGKPLSAWVKLARAKDRGRAADAVAAFRGARFRAGAAEVCVPVLIEILDRADYAASRAVGALADYGPLAGSAIPALRAKLMDGKEENPLVLAALIRVGDDVAARSAQWTAWMNRAIANYHSVQGKERNHLLEGLSAGVSLGPRGDAVAPAVRTLYEREVFGPGLLFLYAEDLGGLTSDWRPLITEMYAKAKDVKDRGQLLSILAQSPYLPKDTLKTLLKWDRGLPAESQARIVKALALLPQDDPAGVAALLRARMKDRDPMISAWAAAGVARIEKDAAVLPTLMKHCASDDLWVWAGAVAGLLHLRSKDDAVLEEVRTTLRDNQDIRVRWRCAALLLAVGQDVDDAVVELKRGIGGPDDDDRLLVFDAIAHVGPPAAPLLESLGPWASFPARLLSEGASRAVAAIQATGD